MLEVLTMLVSVVIGHVLMPILGLILLIGGKFSLGSQKAIKGLRARIMGLVCLAIAILIWIVPINHIPGGFITFSILWIGALVVVIVLAQPKNT